MIIIFFPFGEGVDADWPCRCEYTCNIRCKDGPQKGSCICTDLLTGLDVIGDGKTDEPMRTRFPSSLLVLANRAS